VSVSSSVRAARDSKIALRGPARMLLASLAAVTLVAAVWMATLSPGAGDRGSLDARVMAVGATVRCPICPEPISVNDVQNAQALQMRQYIRSELQRGLSADQVRQELVEGYGAKILLAPPPRGFDLLVWIVPLAVVSGCGVVLALAVRRWSRRMGPESSALPATQPDVLASESLLVGRQIKRYEAILDRELAAQE
jgi:cytochrome c-type biogenesis protein CcmH/NrfF